LTDTLTMSSIAVALTAGLIGVTPGVLSALASSNPRVAQSWLVHGLGGWALSAAPVVALLMSMGAIGLGSLAWARVPKTGDAALGPLAAMGMGGLSAIAALFELMIV
jgi:hypothetical protein